MEKYRRCKHAVEGNDLMVNIYKTKGMQLLCEKERSVPDLDLSGVCGEQVGCDLFSVQNVRVHCYYFDMLGQVSLLSCWEVLVIIV